MRLNLDGPEGTFSSVPLFLSAGSSKEDFDNLGDSIVAEIRDVIELIEKEKETPLNSDYKEEETQLPIRVEEPTTNRLEQRSE